MAKHARKRRRIDRPWWVPSGAGWPRNAWAPGRPVRGFSATPEPSFAIVGEGPGPDEAIWGYPMIGATGQEVDRQLARIGLSRKDALVTNVTWQLPEKRGVLGEANPHLQTELDDANVPIIVAFGRHAIQHFLGDVDVMAVHGQPYTLETGQILLPGYHPAAGMHMVELSAHVQADFDALRDLLNGDLDVRPAVEWDPFPAPQYSEVDDRLGVTRFAFASPFVAIDTEGSESVPWGLSFSSTQGEATVIRASSPKTLQAFLWSLVKARDEWPDFLVLLHNSMHDLPVLRRLGIDLIALGIPFVDTMILAYQLGIEPQGLKPLAIRHAGMVQPSYEDTVGPYTRLKAIAYLEAIVADPDPPPAREWYAVVQIKDGVAEAKTKKPTAIAKRAQKILKDVASGKVNKDGEPPDPYARWYQIDDEDRLAAELKYGYLTEATLDAVPDADAIRYSARDADATRRIGPVLLERYRATYGVTWAEGRVA